MIHTGNTDFKCSRLLLLHVPFMTYIKQDFVLMFVFVHTLQNVPTSFSLDIWLCEIYDYRTHKFFLRLETMVQHVLRNSRSYQLGLADRRMKSTVLSKLTSALLTSCILQIAAGQEQ